MQSDKIGILKHALGLNYKKEPYRNYYIAGENHEDFTTLQELVAEGLMIRCDKHTNIPGYIYRVTKKGKKFITNI